MFESATIVEPVSCGQIDFLLQPFPDFLHKATQVAITNVGGNHNPSFAVLAANLVGCGCQFQFCHFRQRYIAPVRKRHGQIRQAINIPADIFGQPDH